MKDRLWPFDFSEQMDEQYNLLKEYSDRLSEDTKGLFKGEIRRKFDEMSLWVCNTNYSEYFIKFFKISQNEDDIYPCIVTSYTDKKTKKVANNSDELRSILLEMIKSEATQKALAYLLIAKNHKHNA